MWLGQHSLSRNVLNGVIELGRICLCNEHYVNRFVQVVYSTMQETRYTTNGQMIALSGKDQEQLSARMELLSSPGMGELMFVSINVDY